MQKWLISADTEAYDIQSYFEEDGYIIWKQIVKYKIGDIVYIYCNKPIGKIMFKACVEEVSIKLDETTDEEWVKLELIEQVDKEELSSEYLEKQGVKGTIRKPRKVKKEWENYIEKFFSVNDKMWMVRAGERGNKFDIFKNNDFAAIGWDLGDLSGKTNDEIKSLCESEYSNESPDTIKTYISMITSFVNEIDVGDYIISSSDKDKREYIVGKCISDYYYADKKDTDGENPQYKNCRDVEWLCTIGWDDFLEKPFGLNPKNSVFKINCVTKKEILKIFKLKVEKRNLIYFGAPGTGKSYILNKDKDDLLRYFDKNNFERVTFHPDYSYANFVGTYKPVPLNYIDENGDEINDITYKYVPGPFMRTLVKALKNPFEPFILVIEEINRANVAAVFGDVFQLLDRDEDYTSEYSIDASEDVHDYLKKELEEKSSIKKYFNKLLGEDFTRITIPSNMFIWATMNSADQGVFPMDTAFKRRWDFKYFNINSGENELKDIKLYLNNKEFTWNDIRKAINNQLISYKINEDKLMGSFFAFKDIEKLSKRQFKEIFKNKIIMYLFEDVARSKRDLLFQGALKNLNIKDNITYYQICDDFDNNELKIFSKKIRDELKLGE